jgi:tetratricopeptide (TPR) repeat protein
MDKEAERKQADRVWELHQWVRELEKTLPLDDAIAAVEARRRDADGDDHRWLSSELQSLLIPAGRNSEAERIIDEMIGRLPDDVRFPIAKASLYLYFMKEPEKALEAIDLALERARRTGFFRREALGVKARILLQLGRGDELSRTLEEIMVLEIKRDIPDIGRERDFVDRAPPGMIAEDVLARYNVFRPRRAGALGRNDRRGCGATSDNPAGWEPRRFGHRRVSRGGRKRAQECQGTGANLRIAVRSPP